jgi:hypothetical protein
MRKSKASEVEQQRVRRWAAVNMSGTRIANRLGISVEELEQRYNETLLRAGPELRARVGARLFEAARKGNIVAIIFWLKTRVGWREIKRELVPVGHLPQESRRALILMPCNLRCALPKIADPEQRRAAYEEVLGHKLPLPGAPTYPEFLTELERKEMYRLLEAHCLGIARELDRSNVRLNGETI